MEDFKNNTNSIQIDEESTFSNSIKSNEKLESIERYESNEMNFRKFQMKPIKPLKTEIKEQRNWIGITKYQPIDTVTKYVDIPIKETKIVKQPKIEYIEKIKEIPKYNITHENKIIEVPEIHFVDKIICDPVITEKIKYIPKDIIQYNTIKKPITKNILVEKKVNKLQVEERIKYETQEIIEEVYNHYDPIQKKYMNEDGNTICNDNDYINNYNINYNENENENNKKYDNFQNPRYQYIDINNNKNMPPLLTPLGPQIKLPENPIIEKVYIPKVNKIIELKKKIDIPIDFPVPYIVPKPKIIDVKVPVFKFNDKFVPVPMKSKIIPKITWTNQVYQVDCIIEKPYLVYHDIIKIVPTDAKIVVNEYPKGICKINQEELSEVDNLALWMRVNADLKKQKDQNNDNNDNNNNNNDFICNKDNKDKREISYSCICSETDINDKNSTLEEDSNESKETLSYNNNNNMIDNNNNMNDNNYLDTLPLHPGHPLNIIHLQNKWIKQDTTQTQNIYNKNFLEAHKNAVFNLSTNYPREVEVEAKQILALQEQYNKNNTNNNNINNNNYIN